MKYIVQYVTPSLKSINIPKNTTEIEQSAFYNCASLTSIDIPDSVTKIVSYAFKGCSNLTTVNIPDSVEYIGLNAFEGCSNLGSVIFNNPDTIIEETRYISPAIPGGGANDPPVLEKVFRPTFDGCDNLKQYMVIITQRQKSFPIIKGKTLYPL